MFDDDQELTRVGTLQEYADDGEETLEEELAWLMEISGDTAETINSWSHPLDEYAKIGDSNLVEDGERQVAFVVSGRCFVEWMKVWKDTVTGSTYVHTAQLW